MTNDATSAGFDPRWLPTGHHWDLHILHYQDIDAGEFTGGGWKLCWHTTESPWDREDSMVNVLDRKNAAPHFVIGGGPTKKHPIVTQMVPLDRAARALRNDGADSKETNRANCIQVEICYYAANSAKMSDWTLKALANLFVLITHRRKIQNYAPQDFSNCKRMTDQQWVDAYGHVGHCMCPDNDHVDPGHLREGSLREFIATCPDEGWDL